MAKSLRWKSSNVESISVVLIDARRYVKHVVKLLMWPECLIAQVKFPIPDPCYDGQKSTRFWSSVIARSDCILERES